jgi:glycosyltransferase involved in cell wall biosynthesis
MKKPVAGRVLMLLENGSFLGDVRVSHDANALVSAGYKVSVICVRRQQRPWRETVADVHVYRFPAPPGGDSFLGYILEYGYAMLAIFALSLLVLVREGFDVVHAHCPPDTLALIGAFYKVLGKRFVFDHHDLGPEMYYYARFKEGGNRRVYDALVAFEKLSCRLADRVIATNDSFKAVEMERSGVPEDRITVVRNGPDLEMLQPIEADPDLRKRAGTILGYVGTIGPQDGLDYLLRALHHLIYDLDRRDVFCVIMGSGKALPRLSELAEELAVDEYIWLTGRVGPEVRDRYLAATDICLDPDPSNPSNDRCTMIKMMEYMALGKPVVAFDLPEHRVTAQDAAVYAPDNDELEFARLIAMLMDDPALRQRMGQIGRKRIQEGLAWPYQAEQLVAAYATLFSK